jgi:hypothetical protein
MPIQQAIHIVLFIPFYHSTRSFQFINTCDEYERTSVLLPKNMLQKLLTTFRNVHCKSLIDKYIEKVVYLHFIFIAEFIYKYDTKSFFIKSQNHSLGFI